MHSPHLQTIAQWRAVQLDFSKPQIVSIPLEIRRRLETNRELYLNAGSLVATTGITSVLGFVFWWLAARMYSPDLVGFASASISAMMLLGAVGMLGLGTLLIGEVRREPETTGSIVVTSALLAGGVSGLLGVLFAIFAPFLSPELTLLSENAANVVLFALGVAFTSVTLILDQSLIGMLRGGLQLWRNSLFAVAKLSVLYLLALSLASATGLTIYLAWMLGNVISLAFTLIFMKRGGMRLMHRPRFGLVIGLGRAAAAHHATNLILQAPTLIMPIAVTTLISASMNASFYSAWMIASFVFVIPSHLSTVLYAMTTKEPAVLAAKMRTTMHLSLLVALPVCVVLFLSANPLLHLFGAHYAEQADWCLRILALGVFPLIIKYHYIALLRVHNQLNSSIVLLLFGMGLEIGLSVLGLRLGELMGLSIGWAIAVFVQALLMWPRLRKATVTA
jgi:O-antigen/teichoic acid export membrane protein